jgi:hypothetical protein
MRVKLIRKFANAINGIDLTNVRVGDVVDMKPHHAALLVAEGWAEELAPEQTQSRPADKSSSATESHA